MSKPSLRQNILVHSVQRLLNNGEQVHHVVLLSARHRLFVPYVAFSGIALFLFSTLIGIEGLMNRFVLGACAMAIAGMATTNYFVLAEIGRPTSDSSLVLFRSSRMRQYAKELIERLPPDAELTMTGSTVITSDWRVGSVIYTLTKRWEATMRELSMRFGSGGIRR